jgi:LAGLIDADG DNA endonuclease family
LLTPIALAHLIQEDEGFKSKGIFLCTDFYTLTDVIRLMNVLIIRYGLKCTLHRSNEGYRIYISRTSVNKVIEIVKPHMLPSMYYKLGL